MELPYLQGMYDYVRLWDYPCCFPKRIMEGPYRIWTLYICWETGSKHRRVLKGCSTFYSLSFRFSFKYVSSGWEIEVFDVEVLKSNIKCSFYIVVTIVHFETIYTYSLFIIYLELEKSLFSFSNCFPFLSNYILVIFYL